MQNALLPLALLACPLGMGLMMWFMSRSRPSGAPQPASTADQQDELTRLRQEVDQLRANEQQGADALPAHSAHIASR